MKNVLCAEKTKLPMASTSEAGVGQSIALHALPADRNCPFPFSAFLVNSSSSFSSFFNPLQTWSDTHHRQGISIIFAMGWIWFLLWQIISTVDWALVVKEALQITFFFNFFSSTTWQNACECHHITVMLLNSFPCATWQTACGRHQITVILLIFFLLQLDEMLVGAIR